MRTDQPDYENPQRDCTTLDRTRVQDLLLEIDLDQKRQALINRKGNCMRHRSLCMTERLSLG
jgi:hypothetical protein